jgi:hypothetical protein
MVRHEHMRVNSTAVLLARGRQTVTKESIVRIDGETRASIVSTLDDVLREPRRGVAGQTGHGALLGRRSKDDTRDVAPT